MTDSSRSPALGRALVLSAIRRPRNACFKVAALAAGALVIAACGGGDDDSGAAAVPPPPNPSGNTAPTISGTPATSVMQNTPYSFAPSASDANGDTLTFSVSNKPSWAAFNTANGTLTGTPTSGDVATYSNIQITVSDGQVSTSLASFSISVVATATGAATLSWTPPQTNTDGSALTDLANYRIYWGTAQNNYPNSKVVPSSAGSTAIVDQLTPATWYFVVTAIDTQGNESAYSTAAQKTVM
jgi:hypothetical protein